MTTNFYVIHVLTGEEPSFIRRARSALDRAGETTTRLWWPRRKLRVRKRGRTRSTLAPLFPGYVILEAPDVTPGVLSELRRCEGFIRFLKNNQDIRPLGGSDLELIRHFLSYGEIVQPSRVTFDVNNRIQVVDGPLAGLEGKIVKVDKRKRRAKVRLDMYENAFLIDLGFELMTEPAAKKEPES